VNDREELPSAKPRAAATELEEAQAPPALVGGGEVGMRDRMAQVQSSRQQVGAELLFRTTGGRLGTAPADRIAAQRQQATQHLRRPVQQMRGGAPQGGQAEVKDTHAAAENGVSGPASALPHMQEIQRAFGKHDVSQIEAHVGPEADAATQGMGAKAYASGNQVALGGEGTDLHTVAHEAAHVVQQRGGVQLAGGVGRDGDAHEQHADAVADRVVGGQSAEALLDGAAKGGGAAGVQRKPLGGAPVQLARPGDKKAAQALTGGVVAKKPPKLKKGERAGGFPFGNYQKALDQQDKSGKAITYTEYDVNVYDGVKRDAERIVVGSDGRCWYTSNHYTSFTEVK
jgi:hypothetical protein